MFQNSCFVHLPSYPAWQSRGYELPVKHMAPAKWCHDVGFELVPLLECPPPPTSPVQDSQHLSYQNTIYSDETC